MTPQDNIIHRSSTSYQILLQISDKKLVKNLKLKFEKEYKNKIIETTSEDETYIHDSFKYIIPSAILTGIIEISIFSYTKSISSIILLISLIILVIFTVTNGIFIIYLYNRKYKGYSIKTKHGFEFLDLR